MGMEFDNRTRIDSKGQITLPERVRQELGLIGGEGFLVVVDGKDIKLRRLRRLKRFGEEENPLTKYLEGE